MQLTFTDLITNLFTTFSSGIHDLGSVHPLIIHFPIAALTFVPLFILLGIIFKKQSTWLFHSAFLLMIIGTLFIFFSITSGNLAAEHLQANQDYLTSLDHHVQLAEKSRLYFCFLTVGFMAMLIMFSKFPISKRTKTINLFIFLVLYCFALITLFNTAHFGAKLVHSHGLHSNLFNSNH